MSEPDYIDKLHNGDCVEFMRTMPDGVVPLVFADPPFNVDYSYDVYDDSRLDADYLAWCRDWLSEVYRLASAHGTFWLAIGNEYVSELDCMCKEIGFYPRAQVRWHYTFGQAGSKNFARSHVSLLYYTKHRAKFHFDTDVCRVPSARQLVYNDKRANPAGKLPDDVWALRPQDLPGGFSPDADVWESPRIAGTFKARHPVPTHMPEPILARIIRICSKEGDLVLDPFGGAMTTAAVAKKLNRHYCSMELSPEYFAHGSSRVQGVRVGDAIEGS